VYVDAQKVDTTHFNRFRNICLFGDSHMRHILYYLGLQCGIKSIVKTCSKKSKRCEFRCTQTASIKQASVLYTKDTYGEVLIRRNIRNCDILVVNYGHWQAGWPGGRCQTIEEYKSSVQLTVEHVMKMAQPHMIMVWLSVNPMPFIRDIYGKCPPSDWRNDVVLRAYNNAAKCVMDAEFSASREWRERWHFLNVFDIIDPIRDVSYDGTHYANPIGLAVYYRLLAMLAKILQGIATS